MIVQPIHQAAAPIVVELLVWRGSRSFDNHFFSPDAGKRKQQNNKILF